MNIITKVLDTEGHPIEFEIEVPSLEDAGDHVKAILPPGWQWVKEAVPMEGKVVQIPVRAFKPERDNGKAVLKVWYGNAQHPRTIGGDDLVKKLVSQLMELGLKVEANNTVDADLLLDITLGNLKNKDNPNSDAYWDYWWEDMSFV